MTINSEVRKAGPFTGNDTTTVFPFTFKVFSADQVGVVLTNDAGNERYAVQGAEYTVTLNPDQNTSPGGLVQIPAPLATGDLLTITSHVPYLQHMDLTNRGGFYPRVINDAADRATIQIQQIAERQSRSFVYPVSEEKTAASLPSAKQRANKVLAFDAKGQPIAGPSVSLWDGSGWRDYQLVAAGYAEAASQSAIESAESADMASTSLQSIAATMAHLATNIIRTQTIVVEHHAFGV